VWSELSARRSLGYGAAILGIAAATGLLKLLGANVNPTTVALSFLLLVLFVATAWGSRPAVAASLLGVVCFNFFFLPPFGTFTIRDPDNWIAFFAFLVTAVTAGQLSASVKRRAEEAEAARGEIERLYRELQLSFERASETEALRKSERLKSALLDAVTHDLRTPLTSIKASVTTLLDEVDKRGEKETISLGVEGRREMLEVINEETDRLDRFIESLMELARIEAGEMQLRKHWGSIEEIVSAAVSRAAPLTRKHKVEVRLQEELPVVRVDERAVAEVLYTLIDNATKYSPADTAIEISARSGENETVRFEVSDEGPGVPANLRDHVFDKFFRAMQNGDIASHKPKGSGMGLAIARGIVEAHGGRIWIEDGPNGRGAKVIAELPTGDQDTPEVRQAPIPA